MFRNFHSSFSLQRSKTPVFQGETFAVIPPRHPLWCSSPVWPWVLTLCHLLPTTLTGEPTLVHFHPLKPSTFSVWFLKWAVYPVPHQGGIHDSHRSNQHQVTFKPRLLSQALSVQAHDVSISIFPHAPWAAVCRLYSQSTQLYIGAGHLQILGGLLTFYLTSRFPNCKEGKQSWILTVSHIYLNSEVQALSTMVVFKAKLFKLRQQKQQ